MVHGIVLVVLPTNSWRNRLRWEESIEQIKHMIKPPIGWATL
jgi:hypothetical protein